VVEAGQKRYGNAQSYSSQGKFHGIFAILTKYKRTTPRQQQMLDSSLIESLLYQGEGTALDFKRDQYPFTGATEEQQSELLKDILAFANSWRQGEAYILIGVKAVTGGRHTPVGTEDHFDDAQLQQFVNYKTNRKVELAYEVHLYEGKKIGVIKIPKQERPVYATKRFGKVDKGVVYYRLGSSTAIATPEEIARMGRDSVEGVAAPIMSLQFANHETRQELGNSIILSSIAYVKPTVPLPDIKPHNQKGNAGIYGLSIPESVPSFVNRSYWREKEEYIRLTNLLKPVAFVVQNQSSTLAQNVRVQIIGNSSGRITVASELPDEPEYENIGRSSFLARLASQREQHTEVVHHGEQWTITVHFGNVQPKSCVWLDKPFYIGSAKKEFIELESAIYADNLPAPQNVKLVIKFNVENRFPLTVDKLKEMPPFEK
jgi:hypothetical protein